MPHVLRHSSSLSFAGFPSLGVEFSFSSVQSQPHDMPWKKWLWKRLCLGAVHWKRCGVKNYLPFPLIFLVLCGSNFFTTGRKHPFSWSVFPKLSPSKFSSVQLLSRVWLFATPRIAAHQASLSTISSQSLLKLMSIEAVIPFSHLILSSPSVPNPSQQQG